MTRGRIAEVCYSPDTPGTPSRRMVFFQGCPLRCRWCKRREMALEGRCSSWEELGADAVLERLARLPAPESDREVLIAGGEALAQPEFLFDLLGACRDEGIHTTVETTLYAPFAVAVEVARRVDRLLVALRLMDSARHLRLTGKPNAPILSNIEFLASMGAPITLRFQLIPGINDFPGDIEAAADFASMLQCPSSIEILPSPGAAGEAPAAHGGFYPNTSEAGMRRAASVFRRHGLEVSLAGSA